MHLNRLSDSALQGFLNKVYSKLWLSCVKLCSAETNFYVRVVLGIVMAFVCVALALSIYKKV